MKFQIHINSIIVPFICMAGSLLFVTSCSENRSNESREGAQQENTDRMSADDQTIVVVENNNDHEFLKKAAEMQHKEIHLGKLAQQKGTLPSVKEMGKMMVDDHTKTLAELKTLAQSKSVTVPTSFTDDARDDHKDLNDKTGNDFDKAYSKMMVDHHEDAIDKFEKAANDSDDEKIREWATSKLPGLRTHLEHAEKCKKESDNAKS